MLLVQDIMGSSLTVMVEVVGGCLGLRRLVNNATSASGCGHAAIALDILSRVMNS